MSSVDIIVPDLPESVSDATVASWHKKPGEVVTRDEVLVEIETDKVILEVPASIDGILEIILKNKGSIVGSRQILGRLRASNSAGKETSMQAEEKAFTQANHQQTFLEEHTNNALNLAIRHLLNERNFDPKSIKNTEIDGHLIREYIDKHLMKVAHDEKTEVKMLTEQPAPQSQSNVRTEKRVAMTHLRKRMAERLLETKNSTAMLTTFNEVNMRSIMNLRKQYGEAFEKRHGARLGFMSFYVKAVVEALKRYPEVNAFIDGNDLIYHNYFDVNIAISTPRGLVTPVLRNVDTLSIADIEKKIKELSARGCENKLTVDDLTGGNFTVTNGGVFGSLMSTPIINPPQSAILGLHAVKDRPMAVGDKIKILPMMYLALSYDHRLIDGRESVSFLVTIKELLEDPIRLLLHV